nr:uncharacterized protein LOC104116673 [Nicotiana tomentosiformis]
MDITIRAPRSESEAYVLANLGSSVDSDEFNSETVVQLMSSVIVEGHAKVNSTSFTWYLRNKYIDYLQKGKLPSDPKESRALRTKATRFSLLEGNLHRKLFFGPLERSLGPGETDYVMREVDEGTCRNHSGAESLACPDDLPTGRAASPGPFPLAIHEMGMDIVVHLPWVPENAQYILLMTDYFSKWVEAHAFKKVREKEVIDYLGSYNMPVRDTDRDHNLKKRLTHSKLKWKEIMPEVLWAYRITSRSSTGETPIYLVNGTEALIPLEIGEPNLRFRYATKTSNDKAMATSQNLADERREAALVQLAAQKQQMGRYYNRRENLRHFLVGDMVLRKVTLYTRNSNDGKLGSNWEGLYRVTSITRKGSYQLESENCVQLPNNLNVAYLKKYYC